MRTLSVFRKDLLILVRDRGTYINLFALPLMFSIALTLALGGVFGGGSSSPITVPVSASTPAAAAVARQVEDISGVTWTRASRDEAKARVDAGKALGAVLVSDDGTRVTFYEDPAQASVARVFYGRLESAVESRVLSARYRTLSAAAAGSSDPEVRSAAHALAGTGGVTVESRVANADDRQQTPTASEQYIPGFTVAFLFFIATTIAQYLFLERERGTVRRVLASPVSRASILVGKLLPHVVIGFGQAAVIFAVGRLLFGMQLGNIPALALITGAAVLAANGFGLMITALSKTQSQATGLATLLVFTLATLAGCYVPLSFMPPVMQDIALAVPQGWAMSGYQDVIMRGAGVTGILPDVAALCAFAVAFFLVGLSRFRFRE